ncbi:MAG: hypothetical protein HYU28_01165 [Actinobacteria bacterium]|nr:hypothetical protein [Actinomycetota bacterium]
MAAIARGDQRRALVIAGAGFGLVLVLFVASRVLGGGGGGEEEPSAATPPAAGDEQHEGAPAPRAQEGEAANPVIPLPELPDTFEIAELRDPFTEPLRPILADLLLGQLIGVPPGGGQPGQPSQPGAVPAGVRLLSIQEDIDGVVFASVDIDGEIFEAAEGEIFGPNDEFMVVDLNITTQCGIFLFGDEPFSLCVGGQPQPGQPGQPGQPSEPDGDAEAPLK